VAQGPAGSEGTAEEPGAIGGAAGSPGSSEGSGEVGGPGSVSGVADGPIEAGGSGGAAGASLVGARGALWLGPPVISGGWLWRPRYAPGPGRPPRRRSGWWSR
jgi:hypothetical protein